MDRFTTPAIPTHLKKIRHPDYRNIFEYELRNRNLWGTETLLGDWAGSYLLIAKDFYPASYVEELIANGEGNPYRHKPGIPTNSNLVKTLRHFGKIDERHSNTKCGFLYISACFLLRNDGIVRGALPDEANVLRLSRPVVQFTMDQMPNLNTVVAMGDQAHRAVVDGGMLQSIRDRGLRYCQVRHPAFAMSDADRFSNWKPVFG